MLGNLCKGDAAVLTGRKDTAALHTDDRHRHIDQRHQQAAEHTGKHRIGSNVALLFHPKPADDLHHHNAEGQPGQHIHGVVALQKASEERLRSIVVKRLHAADGCGGIDQ